MPPRKLPRPRRPWIPAAAIALVLSLPAAGGELEGGLRSVRSGGIPVEAAALIMSGQEGGEIPLEVLAVPLARGEAASAPERTQVLVVVEAAGEALLADHAGGPLAFDVMVYAVKEDGALGGTLMQSFEIELDLLGERLRASGVKFVGDLGLPPGRYTLRVMVRCPASGKVGLRGTPLEVPEGEPTPSLPLVFPAADDAWIVARETGPGAPATPLPAPAARPVLTLGQEASIEMATPPAGAGAGARVSLADPEGGEHELEARLGAAGGFGLTGATFVPADLPAGAYRLRGTLEGAAGSAGTATAALPVVLVRPPPEGSAPGAVVWPALGRTSGLAAPGAPRTAPGEPADAGTRAVRKRLDKVLRSVATGDDATAHTVIWELVSSSFDGSKESAPEALDRAEARGFRAVGAARPEGLVPIMVLYDWLYREGLEANAPAVFSHARTTLLKLVNLFLRVSNGPGPARQAAQMLTSLGGVVQKAGLLEFSEELFLRAVALDPASEASLLALAVNDEKVGNYEAAAAHLKDLLKLDPGHGEARLRMALNLARGGKVKAAAQHLERIIAGKGNAHYPSWVVSLAYQELAKLHLAAGRVDAAGEVVRAGIARLPRDEKLNLLLAFVYDAEAKPGEALRVLSLLDLPRPEAEGSPRHRYALWPSEALAETRSSFLTTAEGQRADLAAALGVDPSEESAP